METLLTCILPNHTFCDKLAQKYQVQIGGKILNVVRIGALPSENMDFFMYCSIKFRMLSAVIVTVKCTFSSLFIARIKIRLMGFNQKLRTISKN